MRYGADAEWFEQIAAETGVKLGPLKHRPELYRDLQGAWGAFWELSPFRIQGFGSCGAIPLTEIEAYCRLTGVVGSARRSFVGHLRVLDSEFLRVVAERNSEDD